MAAAIVVASRIPGSEDTASLCLSFSLSRSQEDTGAVWQEQQLLQQHDGRSNGGGGGRR